MGGWVDGWMGGCVDGWMGGCTLANTPTCLAKIVRFASLERNECQKGCWAKKTRNGLNGPHETRNGLNGPHVKLSFWRLLFENSHGTLYIV